MQLSSFPAIPMLPMLQRRVYMSNNGMFGVGFDVPTNSLSIIVPKDVQVNVINAPPFIRFDVIMHICPLKRRAKIIKNQELFRSRCNCFVVATTASYNIFCFCDYKDPNSVGFPLFDMIKFLEPTMSRVTSIHVSPDEDLSPAFVQALFAFQVFYDSEVIRDLGRLMTQLSGNLTAAASEKTKGESDFKDEVSGVRDW